MVGGVACRNADWGGGGGGGITRQFSLVVGVSVHVGVPSHHHKANDPEAKVRRVNLGA